MSVASNGGNSHDGQSLSQKLNWLRAGVLGANDGIVSVAATVVGVAGATSNHSAIATAGLAAISLVSSRMRGSPPTPRAGLPRRRPARTPWARASPCCTGSTLRTW